MNITKRSGDSSAKKESLSEDECHTKAMEKKWIYNYQ